MRLPANLQVASHNRRYKLNCSLLCVSASSISNRVVDGLVSIHRLLMMKGLPYRVSALTCCLLPAANWYSEWAHEWHIKNWYFPYLMRKRLARLVHPALLLWVLLLGAGVTTVSAQAPPLFQVIHLPRKAGYSKEKLNTELAPLKDKEAVKKLLRYKNFPSQTTVVLQVARPGVPLTYWTLNTSAPTDKEEARIILQSRDNTSTRFYKLGEFKTFFKDTVAVLDTLAIELLIHDEAYPDDGYQLSAQCGKGLSATPVPLQAGKLVFTEALAQPCAGQPFAATIYNQNNPGRVLAQCRLVFLTPDDKERLLSIAGAAKQHDPSTAGKDIASIVYGYALNHYGRIPFPQLLNWLQKMRAASTDGRY